MRESELTGTGSEYARLTELVDTGNVTARLARRLSNGLGAHCVIGPWTNLAYAQPLMNLFQLAPLSLTSSFNSAFPDDRNNGAMWSGRGTSLALEGGLIFRAGRLTVGVLPVLRYEQNRAYKLLPAYNQINGHEFSNGLYGASLDMPQRFGSGPYRTVDAGQSFARIAIGKTSIGVSNENVWWGPGISNAISFTNTSPGFEHVFFQLREPLNVGIGGLTAEVIWGRLTESPFFDTDSTNDHTFMTGTLITLKPAGSRGLFFGMARTFATPFDSASGHNLFPFSQTLFKKNLVTPDNPYGNSNDDQRTAVMARYVVPSGDFEVYGEWAREDHSVDKTDFLQEPEHSAGHVFGLQKVIRRSSTRWIRINLEASDLQPLREQRSGLRNTAVFYVHTPHGHTQRGQLLGASIGSGSESQYLSADQYSKNGSFGIYVERVRRDEFSERGQAAWGGAYPPKHDVETTTGFRMSHISTRSRFDVDLARSYRFNRNFLEDESNIRLLIRATWIDSRRKRLSAGERDRSATLPAP